MIKVTDFVVLCTPCYVELRCSSVKNNGDDPRQTTGREEGVYTMPDTPRHICIYYLPIFQHFVPLDIVLCGFG